MSTQITDTQPNSNTLALLTFIVGGQIYGLPAIDIVRIIEMVAMTRLPGLPPAIPGVINVQGTTVPLLDMRRHFGLSPQAYGLRTPVILVNRAGRTRMLGLVVDTVEDMVSVPFENLEIIEMMIPAELAETITQNIGYLAGAAKVDQQLILVLNVKTLLNPNQRDHVSLALENQ